MNKTEKLSGYFAILNTWKVDSYVLTMLLKNMNGNHFIVPFNIGESQSNFL
jgi:hypothetical protein